MSRILLPTKDEIIRLANVRADACVSMYVETSPVGLHAETCRIELGNMIREVRARLEEQGFDKRRAAALVEELDSVAGAEDFCLLQSNSLAVLATPDMSRIYRLPNFLPNRLEIADRFYLKPLLRALTFSHRAYILALSENEARLIGLFPDSEPEAVRVPDMPTSASDALKVGSLGGNLNHVSKDAGTNSRKQRLADYSRMVDESLHGLLAGCDAPLILAAAEPTASIFRSVSNACLLEQGIPGGPDKIPDHELAEMARPLLDDHYARQLEEVRELFDLRAGQQRASTDLGDIARAATYGIISLALVDFDKAVSGTVSEEGLIEYGEGPGAYGVIDEIVKRALEAGARVLAVRAEDMVGDTGLAVILRYPLMA